MKRILPVFSAAFVLLFLCGCFGARAEDTDFFAMDTYMSVRVYGSDSAPGNAAKKEAERLESLFSVTDEKSEIATLNRTGTVAASDETVELVSEALRISGMTDGALDVTVYPAVKAWGFTTGSLSVPDEDEIERIKPKIGYGAVAVGDGTITLPDGVEIDLGAVAKGYLGDRIIAILKDAGVTSAIIDLGGNIQTVGSRPDGTPWRVAIRDPAKDGTVGVVEITDLSVVTSGGYERFFTDENGVKRWHIIDPATACPADSGILSATVIGERGVVCDGLSTAIFVMGPERAIDLWRSDGSFEMILVTEREILVTEGISASFIPDGAAGYDVKEVGR